GGLHLPNLLRADQARRAPRKGRARSVILLFLSGGAATQDMVDMKPDAPADIRGEFRPGATNVPRVPGCEHLPLSTRWMHHPPLLPPTTHKPASPNPPPPPTASEDPPKPGVTPKDPSPPSMGSVCEYLRSHSPGRKGTGGELPAYVYMPCYLGWGQVIRRP